MKFIILAVATFLLMLVFIPFADAVELETNKLYKIGSEAKACWSVENAKSSLDILEQVEYKEWERSYRIAALRTNARFCTFGQVAFFFLTYYEEDGAVLTWTDMDGDVWKIAVIQPASFRSPTGGPIYLFWPVTSSSLRSPAPVGMNA